MATSREDISLLLRRNSPGAVRIVVSHSGKYYVTDFGRAAEYCLKLWATELQPPTPCTQVTDAEGAGIEIIGADIYSCVSCAGNLVFAKPICLLANEGGSLALRSAGEVFMADGELVCIEYGRLTMEAGIQRALVGGFPPLDLTDNGPLSAPFFLTATWAATKPRPEPQPAGVLATGAVLRLRVTPSDGLTLHVAPGPRAPLVAEVFSGVGSVRAPRAARVENYAGDVRVAGKVDSAYVEKGGFTFIVSR